MGEVVNPHGLFFHFEIPLELVLGSSVVAKLKYLPKCFSTEKHYDVKTRVKITHAF